MTRLNSIKQNLSSAASTLATVPGRMKASAVNGKDYTVTALKNNPGKTAIVAGSTGALAAAGAVALLVTATSLTAGIALAVIAGLALAFAIYTAVQAKMKSNVTAQTKAPVETFEKALEAAITSKNSETADAQLNAAMNNEVLLETSEETVAPQPKTFNWNRAAKIAGYSALALGVVGAGVYFGPAAVARFA